MMIRCLTLFALMGCAASVSLAQNEAKPGKKKKAEQVQMIAQLEKKIETAEPTEEQKAKLKALSEEFKPKFLELTKKYNEAVPEEVRRQMASARKELTASGTKGKELAAALKDKVSLSEEQKKATEEMNSAKEKLQREFIGKVSEILTPEQLTKAGIKVPKAKKAA